MARAFPLTVSGFARATSPPHSWGRGAPAARDAPQLLCLAPCRSNARGKLDASLASSYRLDAGSVTRASLAPLLAPTFVGTVHFVLHTMRCLLKNKVRVASSIGKVLE